VLEEVGFVDIAKSEFDAFLDTKSRELGTLYVDARKKDKSHTPSAPADM
jgi:hypothetical protein